MALTTHIFCATILICSIPFLLHLFGFDSHLNNSFVNLSNINIINELGQLVQTVEITKENNYQVHIDVNSRHALNQQLQPGVYFITGTINDEVITKKIVIQ